MKKTVAIIVALSVAGIASAGTITTPHIAGDFNGWNEAANMMTDMGGDVWEYTMTGLAANQRQEFKITDGTWGTSIPAANSWLFADGAGNVTITYDGNTYADNWSADGDRIGLNIDPGAWTAAGDFNGWDNAGNVMADLGGGIYEITIFDLADNTYLGKPVVTGSWDGIGAEGRSVDAWNFEFTTAGTQNDVVFSVNALTGAANVEVIPEPATLGLLGMAGMGMFFFRRKLKK